MKPGNKLILTLISLFLFSKFSIADDKITTSPLINIEKIKPSFESLEEENENSSLNKDLKTKKKEIILESSQAILIGLDKITAKSSELIVNLNESKKFGPLEIKILKCGKLKLTINLIALHICR